MATDAQTLRDGFTEDDAAWADIKQAGQDDVKALGPDSTWPEQEREFRRKNHRPCLSFDELSQYVNQLVNDIRETKRAIEVNPSGDDTSEDLARLVGAWIRQVEYRSNAQLAYTQMFDDAASRSYGFLRIVPRYVQAKFGEKTPLSARAFEQELFIDPIPNPELVTPGFFVNPDFSDCKRFWVDESYERDEFNRRWPEAKVTDWAGAMREVGPRWMDGTRVWVRECWELRSKPRKLVLLPNPADPNAEPMAVWVDTIPKDQQRAVLATALKERTADEPMVYQCITNGLEVLEETTGWPGRYLPIIGCAGKIQWLDGERTILSLIRLAKDPQQLYNYYRTNEAEIVGRTSKSTHMAYKGALSPTEAQKLADSTRVPVGVVYIDPYPEGWDKAAGPVPFPVNTSYEPPIQSMEVGAESTRRSIQSATGTGFMPTQAQRQNEKSGVALKQIETSAQKGAYHFVDHYEHAIRRVGLVLTDLFPHYNDTPRTIAVRGRDDSPIHVRVNDPQTPAPKEFGGKPIPTTTGEFDITISTGPGYASERDKASKFADLIVSGKPETWAWYADLVIKLKELGPVGDEMAERAKLMLPPPIQQMLAGQQPATPREQQLQAQVQQMQQALQGMQQFIASEQVKIQGQLQGKQLDNETKLALQQMQDRLKLELAQLQIAADAETREDEQRHEMAMAGANAAQSAQQAERAATDAKTQAYFSRRD